jgi:branched-chain amino acid transport system permease protein
MSDENPNPTETETSGPLGGGVVQQVRTRWTAVRNNEGATILFTIIGVALFPYLFARAPVISDLVAGYQGLAGLILVWGIFALGFDLLLGRVGLLSFGHAALWGIGAYVAGWVSANVIGLPVVLVVVGMIVTALFAWLFGWLSLRRGGIYFSILTLVFAQMIYFIALGPAAEITGGDNGFTSVDVGLLFGTFELYDEIGIPVVGTLFDTWLYVLIGVFVVLSVVAILRILNSPYGTVFRAIRENEQRAEFVGLNVWRYKLMAFILSGVVSGLAGSLFAIHGQYVPLGSLYWTTSGEIVIMTVLGGVGTLFGPILGAGLYLYVKVIVGLGGHPFPWFKPYWHLALGLLFVAVVVLLPEGIWGGIRNLRDWIGARIRGER